MSTKLLFYETKKKIERLQKTYDNESMRHDLIIYPLLTSQFGLGWDGNEIIPQRNLLVEPEIVDSYIWKNAAPKKRRPDLVIIPYGFSQSVAIIEEKKKQADPCYCGK